MAQGFFLKANKVDITADKWHLYLYLHLLVMKTIVCKKHEKLFYHDLRKWCKSETIHNLLR